MLTLSSLLLLAAAPDAGVITRLDLARTWEAAQLFHPSVMHREVDLDSAFVAAFKALDTAKNPEERRAAVALVLAPLKDPSTRVITVAPPAEGPMSERVDGGVLTLYAARVKDGPEYWGPQAVTALLGDAKRIVVDLRGASDQSPVISLDLQPPAAVQLPATQVLAHVGLDARQPSMYHSRLEQTPGSLFEPNPKSDRRFAIVLQNGDPVPDWAIALRETGNAVFVSSDELTDEGALAAITISLGDQATAHIRTTEYVDARGLVATDVRVPKGKDPLALARDALKSGAKTKKTRTSSSAKQPLRAFALAATASGFPDREHRMLAALRMWLIARRFWAYPYLTVGDADQQLVALFTKLETTTTLAEYRDALAQTAVTLIPDSHVWLNSQELFKGLASPPFLATWVEEQPMVHVRLDTAGHVKRGDVLVEIDGKSILEQVNTRLPFNIGSRLDGRRARALDEALLFPAGPHRVTVQHADGKKETAEVTWNPDDASKLYEPEATKEAHFKVLPDNLGFIDLVNLEPNEVDAAMDAVKDTKGLLFDIRGYPNGTAFDIGPRLGPNKEVPGVAWMCSPLVRAGLTESNRQCEAFMQRLTPWEGRRYTRPMVALINLEAISHAEHSCLIFEAYGNVTFVGSPTMGANGNVSRINLPGGLRMNFTGLEVKHADGRALQKVGIEPHVVAQPTLAGIRAGKDEVLDKGLSVLRTKTQSRASNPP